MVCSDLRAIARVLNTDDLIFSYGVKSLLPSKGITLIVHQQETGFTLSLSVQLKENAKKLIVTDFTVMETPALKRRSLSLYDAATFEIVLQALDLLFISADEYDSQEIEFILSEKGARHLASFEGFFDTEVLILYPYRYDKFVNATEIIKAKTRYKLWAQQRYDYYLRNYLQKHQKGLFSVLADSFQAEKAI